MASSDFSHRVIPAFPNGYTFLTSEPLPLWLWMRTIREIPSSCRRCVNIPLPVRRGRTTQHFGLLVVYCLHPVRSGSAFPILFRRSSIRFMLRTANLLSIASTLESLPALDVGYMASVFTMTGLAPASACKLSWAHVE